ncbi:hypothetical protein ES703_59988 [subsurface metagenome]
MPRCYGWMTCLINRPLFIYIKTYFSLKIRVDTVWTKSLKMTQFK